MKLITGLLLLIFPFFQKSFCGLLQREDTLQSYAKFINKVQDYQNAVKLIDLVKDSGDRYRPWTHHKIDTSTFNINYYISLFDQCKPSEGIHFYLYNNYHGDAGYPILYAKSDTFNETVYYNNMVLSDARFLDSIKKISSEYKIEQLIKLNEENKKLYTPGEMVIARLSSLNRAYKFLSPIDSKMGYLQYLFFYIMGERFALFWHAYYGTKKIISSKESIEYHLNLYKTDKFYSSIVVKPSYIIDLKNLLNTDLSPVIKLEKECCFISWYEMNHVGAIDKCTYSVQRHPPYRIKKVATEEVVNEAYGVLY